MKILKYVGLLIIALFSALVIFLIWAQMGENHEEFIRNGECRRQEAEEIKVVSYNMAYGRGLKDDRGDLRSRKEIEESLAGIAGLISQKAPDIILLQEVDLNSERTHNIDEAEYIAQSVGFECYACVTTWVKNYVPYPLWPPSQHYGRMKSGQCILSKYPIISNKRISLPERKDKPFYYVALYLDRAIQKTKVSLGSKEIVIFNVHLEAFNIDNREKQVEILASEVKKDKSGYIIVGGDFNALPPKASLKKDFPDLKGTENEFLDVESDETISIFAAETPFLHEVINPLEEALTFPADNPNRRLDYIFFNDGFEKISGKILEEAGAVSDHLPVYINLKLK